ncbi:DedA family protein [Peribacillus tepidiphilus]|uniref:DedA family protein n=1 Tax=Peribacillus tepidiphilus TaxID=2652445 RepID=UPI0035B5404E
MDVHELLSLIEQYGYIALFLCLWLGIAGMPIPDEMVVMMGGFVSSLHILKPVPAFFMTFLGVISGLSIGYVLGKFIGTPILERLTKRKKIRYIRQSQRLLHNYGHFALIISYFVPVVRHIVPYLVGLNKMPFKQYAFYSYSTGFAWTLLYFILGNLFGQNIEQIVTLVTKYGLIFGVGIFVALIILFFINHMKSESVGSK